MNLRDLLNFNFNSRVARKFLELYYRRDNTYTIPFGPLRGLKMLYDPRMNFHTILGLSDLDVFRVLQRVLSVYPILKGAASVDLGANRGLYSLWLARTKSFSKVYSFEPTPHLVEQLLANARINQLENMEVFAGACADKVGKMELFLGDIDSTSSLVPTARGQKIVVPTTSLDEFFYGSGSHRPKPSFIKMDIEGGGVLALPGADRCIKENRPLLYLESHSPDEDRQIGNLLMTFDYQAFRVKEREWVELAEEVYPNPRGVWGNVVACPTEHHERIAQALQIKPTRWQPVKKAA